MADITDYITYINHVEMGMVLWDEPLEEVLGGTGGGTIYVQDRDNDWEPEDHWDVKVVIRATGWVLFRGEIVDHHLVLEVGEPFRTWELQVQDYNNEIPQRKVGALDGKTWQEVGGFGIFVNIDPNAETLKSDKLTIQNWFDVYFRVDGEAIDTDTFVNEYLPDFFPFTEDFSDLGQAIDNLAALIADNVQGWIDPDLKYHWVAIPAWQDLLQDAITVGEDEAESLTAMGFPEGTLDGLPFAPLHITGDNSSLDENTVGFGRIEFDFDGDEMPQQVYVQGSTGYVYNAPAATDEDTRLVVKVPIAGSGATYQLQFLATTKLWHVDSTGFISLSFDTVGASGPYSVKYIQVPWSVARHKGGGFWKLLSGPNTGKLVDNDTNVLAGYGSIRVTAIIPPEVGDPKVGIGGSGWTNEVTQDPNKRQAYLEAEISRDKATRDKLGRQALYRGATPTLRGSVVVRGYDGWRAGQVMKITDSRLPARLNGRYYVIQRVKVDPIPETGLRSYTLDFGDGPESRYTAQEQPGPVQWPPGANQFVIEVHDLSPGPNSTQTVTGQLVNNLGQPWKIAGKQVLWSLEAYNSVGTLISGQGELNPTVSVTDKYGKARTKFTSGSMTGLVYYIFGKVPVE